MRGSPGSCRAFRARSQSEGSLLPHFSRQQRALACARSRRADSGSLSCRNTNVQWQRGCGLTSSHGSSGFARRSVRRASLPGTITMRSFGRPIVCETRRRRRPSETRERCRPHIALPSRHGSKSASERARAVVDLLSEATHAYAALKQTHRSSTLPISSRTRVTRCSRTQLPAGGVRASMHCSSMSAKIPTPFSGSDPPAACAPRVGARVPDAGAIQPQGLFSLATESSRFTASAMRMSPCSSEWFRPRWRGRR